jgi:hypothetical protein
MVSVFSSCVLLMLRGLRVLQGFSGEQEKSLLVMQWIFREQEMAV